MPPSGLAWSWMRERLQMICSAVARSMIPATHAAVMSPRLWPTTPSGSTPHERHRATSPICSANMVGCKAYVALM